MKDCDTNKEQEDEIWSDGFFSETLGSKDIKDKMKTFHMKHDEDMRFSCKKCNAKISAHNKAWHNGLCDVASIKNSFQEKAEHG